MPSKNLSRRNWLKNAGLLSTGISSLAMGSTAFTHPSSPQPLGDAADEEEQVVRLLYNENPYGPPASALAKVMAVANRANRYPTFSTYDFNALRRKIVAEEGLTEDHVLLGHGSFQPIIWLAEHFRSEEGEIIVPSPTFDIVGMYGRRLNARIKAIEVNDKLEMNLEEMARVVNSQTTLVCLCNPNNPTGTLTDPARMRDFCASVSNQCPVLVDEAYLQYTDLYDDWRAASMVDQIKAGKNVIVSRTFSKIYGMAGFRIGYLLGQPELIKQLNDRFTLGFPGNMPNTISVAAAIGAMDDVNFLDRSRQQNALVRAGFYQELETLNLTYQTSQTNFVYFEVPDFPDFKKLMNDHQILLAGGWPSKPNWARVTMGKPEELSVFYGVLKTEEWR